MDFTDLWSAICKAGQSLTDAWIIKVSIACFIPIFTGVNGSALAAFITLVFIDLMTKWLAICYRHLREKGKPSGILHCIADVPNAMKEGYINSEAMKHRFAGKILVYTVLTIVAAKADTMLLISEEAPVLLKVTWIYLAMTEAISVLENLRDAGLQQAGELLAFLRDKSGALLAKWKR